MPETAQSCYVYELFYGHSVQQSHGNWQHSTFMRNAAAEFYVFYLWFGGHGTLPPPLLSAPANGPLTSEIMPGVYVTYAIRRQNRYIL